MIALVFIVEILIIQVFIFLYITVTTTGKVKVVKAPRNIRFKGFIISCFSKSYVWSYNSRWNLFKFYICRYGVTDLVVGNYSTIYQNDCMWCCLKLVFCKREDYSRCNLLELIKIQDPIVSGFKFTLKYHIGSVIFSSILTFVLWPVNVVLSYARMRIPLIKNKKSKRFYFWMNTCTPFLIFYEEWTKYVSHKNLYQVKF